MYHRKASLDQRPIIMMEKLGTCAKYTCVADPERIEYVPILAGENPRKSSPTIPAADCILVRAVVEHIVLREFLTSMVLTQVSMAGRTMNAHDRSGCTLFCGLFGVRVLC